MAKLYFLWEKKKKNSVHFELLPILYMHDVDKSMHKFRFEANLNECEKIHCILDESKQIDLKLKFVIQLHYWKCIIKA